MQGNESNASFTSSSVMRVPCHSIVEQGLQESQWISDGYHCLLADSLVDTATIFY